MIMTLKSLSILALLMTACGAAPESAEEFSYPDGQDAQVETLDAGVTRDAAVTLDAAAGRGGSAGSAGQSGSAGVGGSSGVGGSAGVAGSAGAAGVGGAPTCPGSCVAASFPVTAPTDTRGYSYAACPAGSALDATPNPACSSGCSLTTPRTTPQGVLFCAAGLSCTITVRCRAERYCAAWGRPC